MGIHIESFDSRAATDGQVLRYHELVTAVLAERLPGDSPPRREASETVLRTPASYSTVTVNAAIENGVWLGAVLAFATAGDDTRLRLDLAVAPDHRRRGVGTMLLDRVVSDAERCR